MVVEGEVIAEEGTSIDLLNARGGIGSVVVCGVVACGVVGV